MENDNERIFIKFKLLICIYYILYIYFIVYYNEKNIFILIIINHVI